MQVDKLATVTGAEHTELLLKFLAELFPDRTTTLDAEKCEGLGIPKHWREFLSAQSSFVPIPWDLIWKPAEQWFPKLRQLVVQKCCGVAVMIDGLFAPALIYVFRANEGFGYCYIGSPPLRASNSTELSDLKLPSAFKDFYLMVHDGFRESRGFNGLLRFRMGSMEDLHSEEDAFRGESPPYKFINLMPIYSAAGGDIICIDVERSSTLNVIGGRYEHEEPFESVFDQDVKELVNGEFDSVCEQTEDRQV
jgi:hypothetical protein